MRIARVEQEPADAGLHPVGQCEGRVQRVARSLRPIVDAFGAEYLGKRILYHSAGKLRPEDLEFTETLKGYRNCGLAGLELDGEPIPF